MLINTVVLFLKDILPVFLALALILSFRHVATQTHFVMPHKMFNRALLVSILCGLAMSGVVMSVVPWLSQYLEGSGAEIFYALGYVSIYVLLIGGLYSHSTFLLLVALGLLTMFHCADFLVYLQAFWSLQTLTQLTIATLLGGGICISIAILMYFSSSVISRWWSINSAQQILIFFATGYLIKMSNLLMQVDVLANHPALYNSNDFLNESSELGYFLVALIGYDATPNLLQVILYFTSVVAPLWLLKLARNSQTNVIKA